MHTFYDENSDSETTGILRTDSAGSTVPKATRNPNIKLSKIITPIQSEILSNAQQVARKRRSVNNRIEDKSPIVSNDYKHMLRTTKKKKKSATVENSPKSRSLYGGGISQ